MQTALDGSPNPWLVPPPRVFAADLGDTVVSSILAGVGAYLLSGGILYLATNRVDMSTCISWSAITAGSVIVLPLAGDALSEIVCDISQAVAEGWYRGQPEPDEPEPEPAPPEPTEDEAGAARVPGAWWYHDVRGLLKCYHTPVGQARGTEQPKPIISDTRMQAIFTRVANSVPFSERRLCDKDSKDHVPGLSGSQFRKLQDDWCDPGRQLYKLRPDHSGYFTETGKRIAEAIRTAEL